MVTGGISVYDIPEAAIHRIFALLSMEDIARLRCTSKKWNKWCVSIPFLSFNNYEYRGDEKEQLMNCFTNLLNRRDEIPHLSITWDGLGGQEETFSKWMTRAEQCNVSSLHLDLFSGTDQDMTLHIDFLQSWNSLKYLDANLRSPLSKIILPSSDDGFSNLVYLKLSDVQLSDEFGDWISSSMKCLKTLILENFCAIYELSINKPSLVYFKILITAHVFGHLYITAENLSYLDIRWLDGNFESRSLHISAPNLVNFFWEGCSASFSCPIDFQSIEYVSLDLLDRESEVVSLDLSDCESEVAQEAGNILDEDNLIEIFSSIEKARTLQLSGRFIDVLYNQGCLYLALLDVKKCILEKQHSDDEN